VGKHYGDEIRNFLKQPTVSTSDLLNTTEEMKDELRDLKTKFYEQNQLDFFSNNSSTYSEEEAPYIVFLDFSFREDSSPGFKSYFLYSVNICADDDPESIGVERCLDIRGPMDSELKFKFAKEETVSNINLREIYAADFNQPFFVLEIETNLRDAAVLVYPVDTDDLSYSYIPNTSINSEAKFATYVQVNQIQNGIVFLERIRDLVNGVVDDTGKDLHVTVFKENGIVNYQYSPVNVQP
jgi:hypothetical protein